MLDQTVEDGDGRHVVAEVGSPLLPGDVARDDGRARGLVAGSNDSIEQLRVGGPVAFRSVEPDLVDDQQGRSDVGLRGGSERVRGEGFAVDPGPYGSGRTIPVPLEGGVAIGVDDVKRDLARVIWRPG